MNYGCIYVATNTVTGEQYVGQTRQKFATRVYAHKISALKPKFKIHQAIAKYGFDKFIFNEVFIAFNKNSLDSAEKTIIADLAPAYNMTRGGAGMPGPVSATVKVKRSEQAKQRWSNPEWKAKTIEGIRAACQTSEFANKAKERLQGKNLAALRWAGHVKAITEPKNRAKITSDTWKDLNIREKRIAGLRKTLLKPEVIAKRSFAALGRKHSAATVRKIALTKYQPLYCKELECTFLSQKHAAKYFDLGRSAITEALKRKGKVKHAYTLVRVA